MYETGNIENNMVTEKGMQKFPKNKWGKLVYMSICKWEITQMEIASEIGVANIFPQLASTVLSS
jgi:hypothetical protein